MTAFQYRCAIAAGLLPALMAVSAPPVPAMPVAPAPAVGPIDPLDNLMKDSPFLPVASGPAAAGQNGPLELRGVIMERGNYSFSLYDLSSKESYWAGLNEPGFPFLIRSYDRSSDTVTVEQQGRSLSLTLASARTLPVNPVPLAPGAPGLPPGATGQPAGAPPNGQTQFAVGTVPSSVTPDEAQRLQRIADEIRRRRAVGRTQPAPPPPSTPPKS